MAHTYEELKKKTIEEITKGATLAAPLGAAVAAPWFDPTLFGLAAAAAAFGAVLAFRK